MKIRLQYALICDDVRREDNGKLILIGVYGRHVGYSALPVVASFSLVVSILTDGVGEEVIEFRCIADGIEKYANKGMLNIDAPGAATFNVPMLNLELDNKTVLEFQWKLPDTDKWEEIFSIPVVPD
ncbi:MAG: hypothetical protein Q7S99_06240 [Parvibaculum sp.]|nr:hypothetical protein [Parvibaculum sp.]